MTTFANYIAERSLFKTQQSKTYVPLATSQISSPRRQAETDQEVLFWFFVFIYHHPLAPSRLKAITPSCLCQLFQFDPLTFPIESPCLVYRQGFRPWSIRCFPQ